MMVVERRRGRVMSLGPDYWFKCYFELYADGDKGDSETGSEDRYGGVNGKDKMVITMMVVIKRMNL